MPTFGDESLKERYIREHNEYVSHLEKKVEDQRGSVAHWNSQFLAAAEVDKQLAEQLAAMTKERDETLQSYLDYSEAIDKQLAASHLECKRLREALEFECGGRCNAENNPCNAREVLDSTPTDTTALDAYVKQEQAKMLRELADANACPRTLRRAADELDGK